MFSIRKYISVFLGISGRITCAYPVPVIGFWLLVTAFSVWLTVFKLGVVNNTNDLIRSDDDTHKAWLSYTKDFNIKEDIVVVIRSPDFELNKKVAAQFALKVSERPLEIESIYWRNDFGSIKAKSLLYLDTDELTKIDAQIAEAARALKKTNQGMNLNSMLGEANREFQKLDEKRDLKAFDGFIEDFISKLSRLATDLEGEQKAATPAGAKKQAKDLPAREPGIEDLEAEFSKREYLAFEEGKILIMLMRPGKGQTSSFAPQEKTIQNLRRDIQEIEKEFPGVKIGLTGEPVLMTDELVQSTKDTIQAAIITFILITILFVIAFKRRMRPVIALFTLVCAVFWSLGATALLVGHLNIISQACVIMILGLGIDFGIQIITRYEEELAKGLAVSEAMTCALQTTGLAVVTTGSITALAFYTMCFNSFTGLSEMGVMAGTGILLCILAYTSFCPAIIILIDRRKKSPELPVVVGKSLARGDWIKRRLFAHPGLVITLAVVGSLFMASALPRLSFDYNLLNLQNPQMPSVQAEFELINSSAASVLYGVVISDSMEEAARKSQALRKLPTVSDVRSIADFFPEEQDKKLKLVGQLKKRLDGVNLNTDVRKNIDVQRARKDLEGLLTSSREALAQARKYTGISGQAKQAVAIFSKLIPALERSLAMFEKLSQEEVGRRLNRYQIEVFGEVQDSLRWLKEGTVTEPITLEDVPPEIRNRFIAPNGRIAIEVEPVENLWERDPALRFVADMRSVDPLATGTPVQNVTFIKMLRDSFMEASGYSIVAIIFLVLLYFRNFLRTSLVLLPLALGVLWTLGVMAWAGLEFNPANIVTLPLVIGIGVAFGVYVIDRFDEDKGLSLFDSSTGKAITLSALTTVISFSSMMAGEYRGMVSIGQVMVLGISLCFFFALFVLPQVLILLQKRGWYRFQPGPSAGGRC